MRREGEKIGRGEEEERTKEDGEGRGRGKKGRRNERVSSSSQNPMDITCVWRFTTTSHTINWFDTM